MARLLYRLGFGAHRRRLAVVLLWLLVMAGSAVGAVTLAGDTDSDFAIPGQESTVALDKIEEKYGAGDGATARVVVQTPGGERLTNSPEYQKAVGDLVAELRQLPGVVSATNPLDPDNPVINQDQDTAYSTVTYAAKQGAVPEQQRDALLDAMAETRSSGLVVEANGTAVQETPHVGGAAEAVGVIIALVVLALTYGTLVTAGMNLLTAAIGVGIGTLGVTIATGFMDLHEMTPILATMLGLAVGIDYALFIINRYRQELRGGADIGTAIGTAVGTAGSAVVTAGITVVIALAGLAVAGIPFLTQMGIAAAATIVVAVLIAITLVPAVLSFLGRRALPRKQRAAIAAAEADPDTETGTETGTEREAGDGTSARPSFLARWIGVVTRHRLPVILLAVVTLGVIAVPAASLQTTLIPAAPEGSTEEKAQHLIADGFGEGYNGPLLMLFDGDNAMGAATQAVREASTLDDVALVTPPVPNADATAAQVTVIPKSGPTTAETERLVDDLRAQLADVDGVETYVTGQTAVSVDVARSLDGALPVYLVLVVGMALILLVLVFRSILVPLVGVLGFLLSVAASFGATVAVFQWGWLGDAVNLSNPHPLLSLTPIIVIGILFGLAMDYQVFLVSRMHEAASHGAEPLDAITRGFRQAAPVVVAAALIMFSVFAGFVPAGQDAVKSIAFALAIGILVDAFVVRMIIVPAALALLGKRAWWLPKWLSWLPKLDVEGEALAEQKAKSADDRQKALA